MSNCENFFDFHLIPQFDTTPNCYVISHSSFASLEKPITVDSASVQKTLKIESTFFASIRKYHIYFNSNTRSFLVQKLCSFESVGGDSGWAGAFFQSISAIHSVNLTSMASHFGDSHMSFTANYGQAVLRHFNESNNFFSRYCSFQFASTDADAAFINSIGLVSESFIGTEFHSVAKSSVRHANWVRVKIIGDGYGMIRCLFCKAKIEDAVILMCGAQNLLFADSGGSFEASDIHSDVSLPLVSSLSFDGTVFLETLLAFPCNIDCIVMSPPECLHPFACHCVLSMFLLTILLSSFR
jgi:hypothetical protein